MHRPRGFINGVALLTTALSLVFGMQFSVPERVASLYKDVVSGQSGVAAVNQYSHLALEGSTSGPGGGANSGGGFGPSGGSNPGNNGGGNAGSSGYNGSACGGCGSGASGGGGTTGGSTSGGGGTGGGSTSGGGTNSGREGSTSGPGGGANSGGGFGPGGGTGGGINGGGGTNTMGGGNGSDSLGGPSVSTNGNGNSGQVSSFGLSAFNAAVGAFGDVVGAAKDYLSKTLTDAYNTYQTDVKAETAIKGFTNANFQSSAVNINNHISSLSQLTTETKVALAKTLASLPPGLPVAIGLVKTDPVTKTQTLEIKIDRVAAARLGKTVSIADENAFNNSADLSGFSKLGAMIGKDSITVNSVGTQTVNPGLNVGTTPTTGTTKTGTTPTTPNVPTSPTRTKDDTLSTPTYTYTQPPTNTVTPVSYTYDPVTNTNIPTSVYNQQVAAQTKALADQVAKVFDTRIPTALTTTQKTAITQSLQQAIDSIDYAALAAKKDTPTNLPALSYTQQTAITVSRLTGQLNDVAVTAGVKTGDIAVDVGIRNAVDHVVAINNIKNATQVNTAIADLNAKIAAQAASVKASLDAKFGRVTPVAATGVTVPSPVTPVAATGVTVPSPVTPIAATGVTVPSKPTPTAATGVTVPSTPTPTAATGVTVASLTEAQKTAISTNFLSGVFNQVTTALATTRNLTVQQFTQITNKAIADQAAYTAKTAADQAAYTAKQTQIAEAFRASLEKTLKESVKPNDIATVVQPTIVDAKPTPPPTIVDRVVTITDNVVAPITQTTNVVTKAITDVYQAVTGTQPTYTPTVAPTIPTTDLIPTTGGTNTYVDGPERGFWCSWFGLGCPQATSSRLVN